MRGLLAFALLAQIVLLAGCSDSPDSAPAQASVPSASAPAMANATLYEFSGAIQGARAADPAGDGPVDGNLPPAKQDTFVVPEGAANVTVTADVLHALQAGNGRVEIRGADGTLAFQSEDFTCSGADAAGACLPTGPGSDADGLAPGTYTVDYLVAGQMQWTVTVGADVPAPAHA